MGSFGVTLGFLTGICIIGSTMEGIFSKSSCMGDDIYSFLWKLGSLYLSVMASYILQVFLWVFAGLFSITSGYFQDQCSETFASAYCHFHYLQQTSVIHDIIVK